MPCLEFPNLSEAEIAIFHILFDDKGIMLSL